jgi:heme exporter protein D
LTTVWVGVGLAIVAVITALVMSWRRRDAHADLGAVSDQWISEHRLDQGHNHRL